LFSNPPVQAKLDDVSKRISSSTSHAIFLALASSSGQVGWWLVAGDLFKTNRFVETFSIN